MNQNERKIVVRRMILLIVIGTLPLFAVLPIRKTVQGLGEIYVSVLDRKIEEMKETSGNRDVSNGGTSAGVTAASAIATMQEQSGKLSRDQLQNSYRAFRQVVYLVIELIRQNYDLPRQFRITGELGEEQFVSYDNRALRPQMQQTFCVPASA